MDAPSFAIVIRKATDFIRSRAPRLKPEAGVILGSGLAKAVPSLTDTETIPYSQIPGFPRNTVPGHEGRLILGRLGGRGVAVLQGRFHYYEGHGMHAVGLPVRVLSALGAKALVVTAAVGSMLPKIRPGHFTVISDHMNFMGRNPLRSFHESDFGTMFPDLRDAYDPKMRQAALAACRRLKYPVHEGVFVACGGPSYETPAEIRAFRKLGGSVVGMSVVPEIITARQIGLKAMALTWTSNLASGMTGANLSHDEVLQLGVGVSQKLKRVLESLLPLV